MFGIVLVLSLAAAGAQGQSRGRTGKSSTEKRITALESEALYLRNEVQALRERLDALLGEDSDSKIFEVTLGDSPVHGAKTALVTLVEFGDYQSEYSARAAHVVGRLLEEYAKRLRFVFKHYPLTTIHPQATEAALAALAAEKQNRGWEMHNLLFKNTRRLDANLFLILAQELGLNVSRFERDRRSLWALERLSADEKEAVKIEVNGVPSFYLNGRRMKSWRYDFLKDQIQALLAGKRTARKP